MIENIKIVHYRECNFWQKTKADLEALLKKSGLKVPIEEIVVENDAQARQFNFFGSPQVMVNGEDIDPMAKRMTNFHASGCRLYFYNGKAADAPSPEMLEEVLRKYASK